STARLPSASNAVTVTRIGTPVVALAGPTTVKNLAAAALSVIGPLVPVMAGSRVSLAVIVQGPPATVFSVTGKMPTPWIRPALAGSRAWPALLVNWTVPE